MPSRKNGLTIHCIPYHKTSHSWLPMPIFHHSQPFLLVYLSIKFSVCLSLCHESIWSHLVGVKLCIFIWIHTISHGRVSLMFFIIDLSPCYEFLSQVWFITQQFMFVGLQGWGHTQAYLTLSFISSCLCHLLIIMLFLVIQHNNITEPFLSAHLMLFLVV